MLDKIIEDMDGALLPPSQYSALTLAYIGDCIYELYVRTYLLRDANRNVNALHTAATRYVRCSAQAAFYRRIADSLTDAELAVFRRGRNTKSHVPKNAEMKDYRDATGVEALLGYLYLNHEYERITALLKHIFD